MHATSGHLNTFLKSEIQRVNLVLDEGAVRLKNSWHRCPSLSERTWRLLNQYNITGAQNWHSFSDVPFTASDVVVALFTLMEDNIECLLTWCISSRANLLTDTGKGCRMLDIYIRNSSPLPSPLPRSLSPSKVRAWCGLSTELNTLANNSVRQTPGRRCNSLLQQGSVPQFNTHTFTHTVFRTMLL